MSLPALRSRSGRRASYRSLAPIALRLFFAATLCAGAIPAQVSYERILGAASQPENWLTYYGAYNGQRYSALTQISKSNAGRMELKWMFQARSLDVYETTPIVADGVLYTTQAGDVVALDAATGRMRWIYHYTPDSDAKLCCGVFTRGLAILGETLYFAAADAHLIALDSKDGKVIWNTAVAKSSAGYSMTLAPLAIKNKILVGTAGGEYGIRGFIAAYDAKTGAEAWRFYTTAGPGDPGQETWGGDSWKHGGGSVWLTGTYDPASNLTYWGIGNAGPDYDGDVRPGDNLYTCSMVALDPDTGKLVWHYQANPHNEFDWDAVQVPVQADIEWHNTPLKAILWANRNGFFYVLDRLSGKFLLGEAFVRQNWNVGFDESGRPVMAQNTATTAEGVRIYPDNQGGTNWFNPSFSPRTGLFYLSARENTSSVFAKQHQDYVEGQNYTSRGIRRRHAGAPATSAEEKYTAIRALDPHTGERKWEFRLDSGNPLSNYTFWQVSAGAGGILTTASDLLFSGGKDGRFVVLDARDGSLLWSVNLGGPVMVAPITYSVGGHQYVAVNAGSALCVFGVREQQPQP